MQTACARAGQFLADTPLDNGDIDRRQRQFARQHQPRRTSSSDHHRMFRHRPSHLLRLVFASGDDDAAWSGSSRNLPDAIYSEVGKEEIPASRCSI
jgi:hypothetical protein